MENQTGIYKVVPWSYALKDSHFAIINANKREQLPSHFGETVEELQPIADGMNKAYAEAVADMEASSQYIKLDAEAMEALEDVKKTIQVAVLNHPIISFAKLQMSVSGGNTKKLDGELNAFIEEETKPERLVNELLKSVQDRKDDALKASVEAIRAFSKMPGGNTH